MVSTIIRRLERVEHVEGGINDCERCANTIIVRGSGDGDISVTKDGYRLSPEAARSFARQEEPHGICPDCGGKRRDVVVGWGNIGQ